MINFLRPFNSYWRTYHIYNFWLYQLLKNWSLIKLARQMAHDPVLVASKMAFLNKYAKGTLYEASWQVYSLKSLLTHYFYMHYLTDVEMQVQRLKCRSCGGSGRHVYYHGYSDEIRDVNYCWHCDGTGTYKKIEIVAFTFHIEGKEFGWHSPLALVDFDVYKPLTKGKYKGEKPAEYEPRGDNDDFLLAMLIVNEFLWLKKASVNNRRYTLPWALRMDISHLRSALPYWIRTGFKMFVDWLIADGGDAYYFNENTIPF